MSDGGVWATHGLEKADFAVQIHVVFSWKSRNLHHNARHSDGVHSTPTRRSHCKAVPQLMLVMHHAMAKSWFCGSLDVLLVQITHTPKRSCIAAVVLEDICFWIFGFGVSYSAQILNSGSQPKSHSASL